MCNIDWLFFPPAVSTQAPLACDLRAFKAAWEVYPTAAFAIGLFDSPHGAGVRARLRRLAARRSLGITEAIKLAVSNELLKDDVEVMPTIAEAPERGGTDRSSLERELEAEIRSTTLEYSRLVAKRRDKKGIGSRVLPDARSSSCRGNS